MNKYCYLSKQVRENSAGAGQKNNPSRVSADWG